MKARNMALCALFAALTALCAWLCVPLGDTPVTLQTFSIALSLWLLGGKRGSLSVLVYLLLGAVGLPVFSGFRGGLGALLGVTGGYILGFLVWAVLYWLICSCFAPAQKVQLIAMAAGLIACYLFGTVWFCRLYASGSGAGIAAALLRCVVPYLLPDGIKLTCAWFLARRLRRFVY